MKMKEESEKAGLELNMQKIKIMASLPITSWQIDGEKAETVTNFIFLGSKITGTDGDGAMKLKDPCSLEKKLCKSRQHMKKQRHYFADIDAYGKSYGFSSSHVWM